MRDLLQANSPVLADLLSPKDLAALSALGVTRRYQGGQLIHSRGDAKPGLSIVRTGAVLVGNVGLDGAYLATSVLGVGQCFGEFTLFAGLPRTHDASALGDTEVDQISKPEFMRLFNQTPSVSQALLTIALIRSHALLEFVDDMRRLTLPVRVAKFFMNTARDSNRLELRQEDIAFTFGVSRVSMGKVLKQLAAADLIELGYGYINIVDRQRLSDWVEARTMVRELKPNRAKNKPEL